jgi:hypothetical protein
VSSCFIVKSDESPDGIIYDMVELPYALEEFMRRVSEDDWAEIRWSS